MKGTPWTQSFIPYNFCNVNQNLQKPTAPRNHENPSEFDCNILQTNTK